MLLWVTGKEPTPDALAPSSELPGDLGLSVRLVGRYYDPGSGQFFTVDPMVQETGQPYVYTGDDPVNGVDPNGLCWSVAPGVAGPCLSPPPGVPYDGSFTPDEIAQYPQVLEGMNPDDVLNQLGWNADDLPPGWSIDQANSSSKGVLGA